MGGGKFRCQRDSIPGPCSPYRVAVVTELSGSLNQSVYCIMGLKYTAVFCTERNVSDIMKWQDCAKFREGRRESIADRNTLMYGC